MSSLKITHPRHRMERHVMRPLILSGILLLLFGLTLYSTAGSEFVPINVNGRSFAPAFGAQPRTNSVANLQTAGFTPFLEVVPSQDGTELLISAGGVAQVGGTAFLNLEDGPGHDRGGWTMPYSGTLQAYVAMATGFTPSVDTFGQMNITTTLGLATEQVAFARAHVLPSVIEQVAVDDMQLSLISPDTLATEAYIAAVRSYAPPGPPPVGHRLVGSAYTTRASGARVASDKPMSLRLAYNEGTLAGADPNSLAIFAWDIATTTWVNLGGQLFVDQQYVTVTTSNFTTFALMTDDIGNTIVRVGSGAISPGGTLTVPVEILNMPPDSLGSAAVEVRYDPSTLAAVNCTLDPNGLFNAGFCNTAFDEDGIDPDIVRLNVVSTAGVLGSQTLAEIAFRAVGATGDTGILSVAVDLVTDPTGIPITVGTQDGQLTVGRPGDVSCDDNIDVVDGLFVLQYDVGLRTDGAGCPLAPDTLYLDQCDVNADNACNIVDALFIMQCDVGSANVLCPAVGVASTRGPENSTNLNTMSSAENTRLADQYDSNKLTAGNLVTVSITARDVPTRGLGAATVEVRYDPAIVTTPTCAVDPNDIFDAGFCNAEFEIDDINPDVVRFNVASVSGLAGDVPLADISFQTVEQIGDSNLLNVVAITATDPNGAQLSFNMNAELVDESSQPCSGCQLYLPLVQR